jgi:hypothetical protein
MKAISISVRRRALWLSALLTAVLCGWTAWRDYTGVSLPASGSAPRGERRTPIAAAPGVAVASSKAGNLLERDPLVISETDLFRYVSFQPPAPNALPPQPPPPPKPSTPAFPYQYFGRIVDVDGRTVTYLARGNSLVPIQSKQLLDGVFRIDAVTETQIVVTYVPLEEKISIAVQSGN